MATKNPKSTIKKSAKKPAAQAAKKTATKTAPKKAVPAPKKAAAKTAVKGAAKTAVKKVVKKAVKKAVPKAPAKKTATKKTVVKKAVAKKTVAKKTAAKKAVAKKATAVTKPATKTPARKTAVKKTAAKVAAKKAAPVSLKGLRVSGAKAARIAEIVAESYANRPAAPQKEATRPQASRGPQAAAGTHGHEPGSALDAAHKAAATLFAKKAEDVVLMDLRELSTVADYYLIATCTNEPQMRAILNTLQRSLSRDGIKSLRSEYVPGVRWAVVDYGDLIVHLFEKQTRGFYSLERLWADAPSTPLKATDYALPVDDDHEMDMDEDGDL